MANFYGLIAVLLLSLLGVVNDAHAALARKEQFLMGGIDGTFDSASAACSAALAQINAADAGSGYSSSFVGVSFPTPTSYQGTCSFDRTGPFDTQRTGRIVYRVFNCPANTTAGPGDACTCNAGFDEKDGQCRPKNPCPEGQHEEGGACVPDNCKSDEVRVNGVCVKEPPCPPGQERVNGVCRPNKCKAGPAGDYYGLSSYSPVYLCEASCLVSVTPSICVTYDGKTECTGPGRFTGASCTGGSGGGPSGPDNPGNNPGTGGNPSGPDNGGGGNNPNPGNGGGGTQPGTGGGGNTGNPPGGNTGGTGGTGPGTGPGGNEPPIKIPGSGPGGSGSGSGVGSLPQPKPVQPEGPDGTCPDGYEKRGSVCIQSPKPPDGDGKCPEGMTRAGNMCYSTYNPGGDGNGDGDGDGTSFVGSCIGGFSCEGDAIFCAISKEQHIRNCKLFEDKSPESQLYDEAKGKTGDQTKDNPLNASINIAGRIDSSDALGGGSCIGDLNITVWGTAVTLPLTNLCPFLAMLGNLLVAVSMLVALRIITRG